MGDVVPAWRKKTFTIKRGHALASGGDITWTYINDYGAERSANGLLKIFGSCYRCQLSDIGHVGQGGHLYARLTQQSGVLELRWAADAASR